MDLNLTEEQRLIVDSAAEFLAAHSTSGSPAKAIGEGSCCKASPAAKTAPTASPNPQREGRSTAENGARFLIGRGRWSVYSGSGRFTGKGSCGMGSNRARP